MFLIGLGTSKGYAQAPFFDTDEPKNFFTFSARVGVNTSNKTFPNGNFTDWNKNGWGTGFNIGILANLNFKEYLTIQPGIFFETKSGSFSYVTQYLTLFNFPDTYFEVGTTHDYDITVPVMGNIKFNVASNVKWIVEFGPYIQFRLKSKGYDKLLVIHRPWLGARYETYVPELNNFDFGFKMGSGLRFCQHYYVGFHYLAGVCNAWKNPAGGKNKSWEFSIGYDF